MSKTLNRTIRTFLQAAVGVISAGVLEIWLDLKPQIIAALVAVFTVIATAVQNALEETDVVPTSFED